MMSSRSVILLSLFAVCALAALVSRTEAAAVVVDGALAEADPELGRADLADVVHLVEKRAAGKGNGGTGNRRGKGGRRKGKGRRKNRGPPVYELCTHHDNGLECTCDMRFEKFRTHPTKQWKFYTIC